MQLQIQRIVERIDVVEFAGVNQAQEPKWGADGRPVHELDSHLRTQPRQSVRLSQRVAAPCWGVEANALGLDALELPRDACADRRTLGCGIGYAGSFMAEKDSLRPGW